jgi:hypothetical protein
MNRFSGYFYFAINFAIALIGLPGCNLQAVENRVQPARCSPAFSESISSEAGVETLLVSTNVLIERTFTFKVSKDRSRIALFDPQGQCVFQLQAGAGEITIERMNPNPDENSALLLPDLIKTYLDLGDEWVTRCQRSRDETFNRLVSLRGFGVPEITRLSENVAPLLTECEIWLNADGYFVQEFKVGGKLQLLAIVGDIILFEHEG